MDYYAIFVTFNHMQPVSGIYEGKKMLKTDSCVLENLSLDFISGHN